MDVRITGGAVANLDAVLSARYGNDLPKAALFNPATVMNNPHNMWIDKNQTLIYQTQWFDSKLTVFNRTTGQFLNNISVRESPAHVMTRTDTDQLHVTLNGSANTDSVVELAPMANGVRPAHQHWTRRTPCSLDEP